MIPADEKPRWRRTRKGVAAVFGMAFFALLGIAVAALLIRGPFTGGGTVNARPTIVFDGAAVNAEDELADCTVTPNLPTSVDVQVVGIGGGTCTVQFSIHKTGGGAVPLKLQDVNFAEGIVDTTFGPGYCGLVVNGTPIVVNVNFTIPETAPTGPFTASGTAGLEVVNGGAYSEANCPA
jgi:hypothetical protein